MYENKQQNEWLWVKVTKTMRMGDYRKCSKISNTKKERTPWIYFLSSPVKQREVTNFAKGGKIGYFPHRSFGIFLFEIKILLYEFLEHLPYVYRRKFLSVHVLKKALRFFNFFLPYITVLAR